MKETHVSYTSQNACGDLKFKWPCLRGMTASPYW